MAIKANGFADFIPSIVGGPVYSQDYDTDGYYPINAAIGGEISFFVGTFTPTRVAQGFYTEVLTPAANSSFAVVNLTQLMEKIGADPIFLQNQFLAGGSTHYPTPKTIAGVTSSTKVTRDFEGHIIRGVQLVAYDVIYTLATAALTTHTGTILESTYTSAASTPTVVVKDAAKALGVATSANVIITNTALTTPFVIGSNAGVLGTNEVQDFLEISIVNPGTAVYSLLGVGLYFNYDLL
jgi:hypothetical protein